MQKIQIKCKNNTNIVEFLLNYGFSYGEVQKLLKKKDVRIDDEKISCDMAVMPGQSITVFCEVQPRRRFSIAYEDDNVAVINKEQEIEVDGKNSIEEQTGFIAVHRLDRNTKGLLVFAKTKNAERILLDAIKNRKLTKKYIAEVVGATNFKGEKYSAYLLKDAKESKVKVFKNKVNGAVPIETILKTIKSNQTSSLVEAELVTGRTHQIRAHLAYLGHPIIGDGKYGKNEDNKRFKERYQRLTAYYLKLAGLGGELAYLNGKEFKIK